MRAWWPDAPGGNVRVRFEHSPGRRDPAFLGNKSAFDVAFDIDAGNGSRAIVGVETKYHEHAVAEEQPKPAALAWYVEVTERSRMFAEGWRERVVGTDLQQIWLDHLLVLAMLQHPSQRWVWGRFVLIFPSANPSFAAAAERYRTVLRDGATFDARTIESLLTAGSVPGCVSGEDDRLPVAKTGVGTDGGDDARRESGEDRQRTREKVAKALDRRGTPACDGEAGAAYGAAQARRTCATWVTSPTM